VTQSEAREILLRYRPGTADAGDPEFAEALALARQDAELARWFEDHCALQTILRDKFHAIAVPEGFKEQILSEHRAWRRRENFRQPAVLAAALVACVLLAVTATWLLRPAREETFAAFRQRMISTALRTYPPMLIETNDIRQIRAALAENKAHADFVAPKPLEATACTGCGVLRWQNQAVSMICFHSGKPLGPGEKSDLFLFVVDRAAVRGAPRAVEPGFKTTNRITTASWVQGDRLYLLAGIGDEDFLRRYF